MVKATYLGDGNITKILSPDLQNRLTPGKASGYKKLSELFHNVIYKKENGIIETRPNYTSVKPWPPNFK